jgi:ubiquinone/menaquinone biosynthesis C-methylase UbiE
MMKIDRDSIAIERISQIVKKCLSYASNDRKDFSEEVKMNRNLNIIINNNAKRIFEIISMLRIEDSNQFMKSRSKSALLEVGIGYGDLILSIKEYFPEIETYGIEHPSRKFLKFDKYLEMLKSSRIWLLPCDVTKDNLPFQDSMFDTLLFCEVVEHISPADIFRVFSELSRVAKVGGAIVVASPNLSSLFNRLLLLKGGNPFDLPVPLDYAGDTFGHIRLYTAQEIIEIANLVGLKMKKLRYNNFMLINGSERKLSTLIVKKATGFLSQVFPSISYGYTILFEKY